MNVCIKVLGMVEIACLCLTNSLQASPPFPTRITILHTNDLHSHFRSEKTVLGLGGIARLTTAIRRIRSQVPNSLLVDGGDWSEGNVYYTEGSGRETLRAMDRMGYDVAVIGNHDWLNGPDVLLDAIGEAQPRLSLIGANFSVDRYPRGVEFRQKIPPYVIKEIGGVKIAFIGLVTYEFIYDKFASPVDILPLFTITKDLAAALKRQADAVVVVSHNSIPMNQSLLKAASDVDFIVGAHDHVKLVKPEIVERSGAPPGWIGETGSWGRYLGRMDIEVQPRTQESRGEVRLIDYRLEQMDISVPEDPEALTWIERLEASIEKRMGPIFHDHVGDSEIEFFRETMEGTMGDFVTDAYLNFSKVDAAIDQNAFIYGELHQGPIRSVDVFNSNPGIFHPAKQKSWTLKILPIRGRTLTWILNLLFTWKKFSTMGSINGAGLQILFDPTITGTKLPSFLERTGSVEFERLYALNKYLPFSQGGSGGENAIGGNIQRILIQGELLNPGKTYRIAMGGGIVEALGFLNEVIPNAVPMEGLTDTGHEDWRIMVDYIRTLSPITEDKVAYGSRIQTVQSDLGVIEDYIQWKPRKIENKMARADFRIRVKNFGASTSSPNSQIHLLVNAHGINQGVEPIFYEVGELQFIPALKPGESYFFHWSDVAVPEEYGIFSITAKIEKNLEEFNESNDEISKHFLLEPARFVQDSQK